MKSTTSRTRDIGSNGSTKGGKGRAVKKEAVIDGAYVVALRKELGQNQGDFWRPMGISQSGGSRYESGRNIPAPVRKLIWAVHVAGLLTDEQLAEA